MMRTDIFQLIHAPGPCADFAKQLMLYGQFVGSWNIDATWYDKTGLCKTGKGEWHFGWILGGMGIQDVLFALKSPPHSYGTSIRCYDSVSGLWHIAWMQPAGREFVHLVGRRVEDRIVQEGQGVDAQRRERWTFADITPTSFLWLGEVAFDGGATWTVEQEMQATRK